ncbi:MAG: hypothetical protein JXB32_19260 [Deltaproteobacteria bacterium]|nr:hypothetical protein [Deltaproteobacteria bacterium]
MNNHRNGRLAALSVCWLSLAGCEPHTVLIAEPSDGRDLPPDADAVVETDGGFEDDGGWMDITDEEDEVDASPPCPIWVSAIAIGGVEDGSREHPRVGLQAAIDGRGDCGHLVLVVGPEGPLFDLAVDVELAAGQRLLVEGETSSTGPPQLVGAGADSGIRAWGDGELELRNLHLDGGSAAAGGCLDADVLQLRLVATRWTDCAAVEDGGAVSVVAADVAVVDSVFLENTAGGRGGALAIDSWASDARVRIEGCDFRRNRAERGGAVGLLVPTVQVQITGTRFVGNAATWSGGALAGYIGGRVIGNRFDGNRGGFGGGAVAGEAGSTETEIGQNVFADNTLVAGRPDPDRPPVAGAAIALAPAYVAIRNNVFLRNTTNRSDCDPGNCPTAAVTLGFGRSILWNNTFVDNAAVGGPVDGIGAAHLLAQTGELDVRSNIFAGGDGDVAVLPPVPPGGRHWIEYNDAWAFAGTPFPVDAVLGPGMLAADPLFRDAGADDYRLQAGSPCVDAGDEAADLRDADGSRNDMGAFGGPAGRWTPLAPGDAP